MCKNVGTIDRIIRLLIGIGAFVAYYQGVAAGVWGYVALAVGVIMVATAAFSFCPLYTLLGLKTSCSKCGSCEVKKEEKDD